MATVHRAKERGIEGFERIVALKRLLPHLAEDPNFVRSFVREARLASQLQHANIVQLYDMSRVGQVYFIAMEYIEGRDVRKILRQARKVTGPPPMSVFLSLMLQLCDALDYAHRRSDQNGEPLGIVHRDVSPSNLLITESGHLKVIDFGIAKAQVQSLATHTGRVKGKMGYMAPEGLVGKDIDCRADLFSVGVIAHELLTATPLFASKNEFETLARLQKLKIEPPSRFNRKCPAELDDIVLKALARNPDLRWQSAAELRDALHFVRSEYQLNATNREVSSWMEWAFEIEAPQTGTFSALSSSSVGGTPQSGSFPSAPQRAFARPQSSADRAPELPPEPPEVNTGDVTPLPPPPVEPHVAEGVPELNDASKDEDADYAWGGDEGEGGVTNDLSLLAEVPDVSDRAVHSEPDPGPASLEPAIESSGEFGGDPDVSSPYVGKIEIDDPADTDITAPHRVPDAEVGAGFGDAFVSEKSTQRKRRAIIVGGLAAAAVIAAAYVFLIQKQSAPSPAAAMVPRASVLKFVIEPSDATIEVLGYGTHEGSPQKLEVDAPGAYRVQIKRPGYRSYVTEIDVEGGETQVVRVVLEQGGSDKAQVKVSSSPTDQAIYVDGQLLPDHTPATFDVTPGTHVLVIKNEDGDPLWTHEFKASSSTQYEFHPTLEEKRKRRKSRRDRDKDKDEDDEDDEDIVEAPLVAESEPEAMESPTGIAQAPSIVGSGSSPGLAAGLAQIEPPRPEPKQVDPPTAPVTIPPNQAKKLSGKIPTLRIRRSDNAPRRGSAKLCIDTRGKVTSVKVLTSMPRDNKQALSRGLKSWRYAPHKQSGQPVPACFAINFKLSITD